MASLAIAILIWPAAYIQDKPPVEASYGLSPEIRKVLYTNVNATARGFVVAEDWQGIYPQRGNGYISSGSEDYLVAMYHELKACIFFVLLVKRDKLIFPPKCLDIFRDVFIRHVNGDREFSRREKDLKNHCLSYLSQATLCHADKTLEPSRKARTSSGEIIRAVFGLGIEHECRDWSQLRDWAENRS